MYQILPETFSLHILCQQLTGVQILLSPKNASKVIFNAREVLRCIDVAKPDILVFLMFMFHLPLSSSFPRDAFFRFYIYFFVGFHLRNKLPVQLSYSIFNNKHLVPCVECFCTEKVNPMVCNELIFHRFIFTFPPKLNSLAVCCSTLCAHMSWSYI